MTRQEAMIEMVEGKKVTHSESKGSYKLEGTRFVYIDPQGCESTALMSWDDGYKIYKEKKVRKLWSWRVKDSSGRWHMPYSMYDDNDTNGSGVSWSNWHNLEKQRLDVLGCVEVEE